MERKKAGDGRSRTEIDKYEDILTETKANYQIKVKPSEKNNIKIPDTLEYWRESIMLSGKKRKEIEGGKSSFYLPPTSA